MNNDWFFEKFALIADAPGAVERMRGLVLQMACSGQLMRRENGRWKEIVLGDVIALISGQHLLSHEHNTEQRGIPYLTGPSDFGEKNPKPTRWTEHPKVTAEPGDILITVKGSGVGKTNVLIGQRTAISRQLMAIRTTSADSDFLLILLQRAANQLQDAKTGIAIPGIGRREVLGLKISLPPLAEQKRIVAKVDELMGICDALEAQQRERESRKSVLVRASLSRFAESPTPENLGYLFHKSYDIPPSELRKSILTLAVQGKLVPQDPNDEPAEESLLPQNRKAATSKNERDVPFELPSAWQWTPLGEVSELINGDRSKNYPNKDEYVAQGIPWINTGHIEPAGTLSMELMHYITRKKFDSLRSGKVKPGDLVYCLRGATLGKTAIITQFDEGAVASSLVIIRLAVSVDPRFAYRFLTSPLGREQIFQFDNGSAQPNLSANNVKKYWMPLPPLAEQHRIVAKVDQLMALVDELERQQEASRENASKLLDAIVQEMTSDGRDIAATLES
jgi:type I restriction enzyme, S subunit